MLQNLRINLQTYTTLKSQGSLTLTALDKNQVVVTQKQFDQNTGQPLPDQATTVQIVDIQKHITDVQNTLTNLQAMLTDAQTVAANVQLG